VGSSAPDLALGNWRGGRGVEIEPSAKSPLVVVTVVNSFVTLDKYILDILY